MRLQRRFLSVIVPVIALALLTLGWLAYDQLRRGAERELSSRMLVFLERIEQQSLGWVDATETNVDLFAGAAPIEDYFALDPAAREDGPASAPVRALFDKMRRTVPQYREIRLLARDGHEELRVAEPGLVNRSEEERGTPWFDAVGLNWALAIHTSVVRHPDDGEIALMVAKPVRLRAARADGAPGPAVLRGYLAVAADLDFLNVEMRRFARVPGTSMALLDADGDVLMTSGRESARAIGRIASLVPERSSADGPSVAQVELDGRRNLVAQRRLFDDLRLVGVVSEEALAGDVGALAARVGIVTLAAIVLASLLFLVLLRSMVLGPIARLRHSAVAIGQGRLDAPVEVRRGDEIGDLAAAFGEMTGRLADSMRELHRSHAQIERLAYRDGLSGLPNRRAFLDLVERAVADADRRGGRLAVMFLDLDDFKRLNDSEGHAAGDRLLREVADRLRACTGMPDDAPEGASAPVAESTVDPTADPAANRVARVGGDEFVVLLGDLDAEPDGAGAMADAVLRALAVPVEFDGRARSVGTSIGIALYPDDAPDVNDLLTCADTAMYAAKQGGRNAWCRYAPAMRDELDARLALESDLAAALAAGGGGLCLHYQPQLSLATRAPVGLEALVRWTHPEHGPIGPDRFVPVAEETGLIAVLGDWVLDEACAQWRRWHEAGVAPPRVAVNVSRRQFALGDVALGVAAARARHGVPAAALEIEITESCVMEGADDVVRTLEAVRATGVHVAMDDFGTGHSSLGALATLPLDALKIDRCFVAGLVPGSANDRIVTAIIDLGAGLGLGVVAEGVETAAELAAPRGARLRDGAGLSPRPARCPPTRRRRGSATRSAGTRAPPLERGALPSAPAGGARARRARRPRWTRRRAAEVDEEAARGRRGPGRRAAQARQR